MRPGSAFHWPASWERWPALLFKRGRDIPPVLIGDARFVSQSGEPSLWAVRLRRGARYTAWAIAAIALAGLGGLVAGAPGLASLGADFPPITPSGILVLAATAAALELITRPGQGARWGAVAAAGFVAIVASLILLEHVSGAPTGVDSVLRPLGYRGLGDVSVSTAWTYLLLSAALGLAALEKPRNLWRILTFGVAGIALVALVGLTFRLVRVDLAIPSVGMSLPVALGLLLACFSLVARQPSPRVLALLEHDSPGAAIVRRLVPAAIALPLLVGWVQALGQRSGWFDVPSSEGAATVLTIVACTALVLWTSARLDEMHAWRDLAEARAEAHREWLEVTMANIGDAVITANAEGRVGLLNPTAETLAGLQASAAVGQPVSNLVELVDERTGDRLECPMRQALARQCPVIAGGDPALRHPDGSLRPVEASAMPILDRNGRLMGGVMVLRDVSARRAREHSMRQAYAELDRRVGERTQALERATSALRESTALLQTFAASTPELIIAKDREGRITLVNPAALRALGMSREEVIGRSKQDLFGDTEETRRIHESDRQVLETGDDAVVEENLITPNGRRTFLVTKSPLRDEYGQVLGVVGVATDITERKHEQHKVEQLLVAEQRLRGEAERASRAKDEFLATVSHELRSPLNALKGWSHVLSGSHNPDPILVTRAAQAIKRNVEHQTRLIDDLLDTSRIISGKLVIERRPTNLVEVVHAAIDLSRTSALAKKIALRFTSDHPVVTADGDPGRLQQVVINLLSNAIKFTPEGGVVEVGLRRSGERIELAVSDSGVGIETDFLPHVFDRFSQADTSVTRRYRGLGIGLALVRHLVELHGGTVRAASAGSGHGATFTVELPASHGAGIYPRPGPAEGHASPQQPLAGIRVLVLDDEPDARDVVSFTLAQAGAQVQAFETGAELIAALQESVASPLPAVVLLDVAMPGEDGFSVLARLRAADNIPFVPAIAVTALTHLDRNQFTAAGFQDWVGKPVDAGRLIQAILLVVGRSGRLERVV